MVLRDKLNSVIENGDGEMEVCISVRDSFSSIGGNTAHISNGYFGNNGHQIRITAYLHSPPNTNSKVIFRNT